MTYWRQSIIKISVICLLFFSVLGFLLSIHLNEGESFFCTNWVRFYGRKDSKRWISHSAVNNVAKKILQLNHLPSAKTQKKEMFPFSILFISSDGNENVVWLNTKYFSFDKKKFFLHKLTGDEMEAFYLAVHQ